MEMTPQLEEEWRETDIEKEIYSTSIKTDQFFPRTSMRVLLVEADDSTRQIVTALLRKCNYRVVAVPDGLKAWEALKGRPQSVDLILTEVELPSISGFTLLTLIMEHEICKKIPVIMMSSSDSISMVFKCMMGGAVDFLIKPLRKNELRNLWQHVWRRQSSAGDRSLAKRKVEAISENNAASNHSSDYVACTKKNKSSSGKGSDAQSSCTKPDMEAESACMQNMQDGSQPICQSSSIEQGNKKEEKSTILGSEVTLSNEASDSARYLIGDAYGERKTKDAAPGNNRDDANITGATCDNSHEGTEFPSEAIDLIGAFDNRLRRNFGHSCNVVTKQVLSHDMETLWGSNDRLSCTPSLELSLKRSHLSVSKGQETNGRHTLNHSNASAFSWYNNRKVQSPLPAYNVCSEPKDSSRKSQKHMEYQGPGHTAGPSQQNSLTSSAVSQSDPAEAMLPCHHQVIRAPVPFRGMSFDGLYASYAPVLPQMFYESVQPPLQGQSTGSQQEHMAVCLNLSHPPNPETQFEEGRHFQNQNGESSTNQALCDQAHNIEELEDPRDVFPYTGQGANSCICDGASSYSNNSGSGGVSNGNNGKVTAVIAATTTLEKRSGEGLFVHDRGMDPHGSTQREAALTKFRLKRKDRCYAKKVRYQTRKRLAEQRPRVKGQFVRQALQDLPSAGSIITNDLVTA